MDHKDSPDDVDREAPDRADPDLEDLARRYLDLWQQYLTQTMQDPALSAALARMAGFPAAGWPAALFGGMPGQAAPRREPAPDGPEAAGSSPDGGGGDIGELTRRVAALEERLDSLERKPGGARKGTAGKPRSRRS